MYLLYRNLRSQSKSWHVFLASFLVFSGLNLLENLVHYSIGREGGGGGGGHDMVPALHLPDILDMTRILGVMFVFAVVNAAFMSFLVT